MSDTLPPEVTGGDAAEPAPVAPPPPKRGPGHRGQDIRDTMAEMAAKAHEISLEAGSKMAAAMRDVVGAAAGISAFAIESARDLVNYMVRRGQMSQEEATKLLREVEEAHARHPRPEAPKKPDKPEAAPRADSKVAKAAEKAAAVKPAAKAAKEPAKPAHKAAAKAKPPKSAAKAPAKAVKKVAPKKK